MDISNEAIESLHKKNAINEEIVIYKGKFCIYTNQKIKCDGVISYKITEPVAINFYADVYQFESVSEMVSYNTFDNAKLEIVGYKLIDIEIQTFKNGKVVGYVNDMIIICKLSFIFPKTASKSSR